MHARTNQRIFDTNFFGVVPMNRAVLPHMRRHSSCLLVHIGSGAVELESPFAFYSASKWALEALGQVYSQE
ncbi:MAG: SDR family NAD(P)-dependent oxidoreductase [Verrucomicrobia bacterium]|nr:SDR family NAD(P)-dependent oxidoreductase [Verrucomicrobiota bacterium]